MILSPRRTAALLSICLLVAAVAQAQKTSLDDLCRVHGIGREPDILEIKKAYREALDAGISEDELLPFMEDILRHKLDCVQMVRVLTVTTKIRREGLPYFVVFSKVREGVAKEAAPAMVVMAAEAKLATLTESRNVLISLQSFGYRVLDFQNAAVVVASYLEKGYTAADVVSQIRIKGVQGAGYEALSGVLEKTVEGKER